MTPANNLRGVKGPNANGATSKRTKVSGSSPHLYDVKGYISKCWMEFRVKAVNADAAIAEGHARGMRVSECVEVKKKRK